ncbi:hypothetical protein KFE25_011040 [Diacronema lutheri]|uniref:PX domain-containing protein n=1 Tax=Diacronema lutheri TaxID=2081491 RepID=A0A8J5X7A9_DIALT|nr:hypothetical protein KFE25_011040 [Diacronema lutheri]
MASALKVGELAKDGPSSWSSLSRLSSRLFVLHPNRLDYYLPIAAPELLLTLALHDVRLSDEPDALKLYTSACGRLRACFDGAEGEAMRVAISVAASIAPSAPEEPGAAALKRAVALAALGACPSLLTAGAPPPPAGGGSLPAHQALVPIWVICSPHSGHLLVLKADACPKLAQRGSIPLLGPGWIAAVARADERALEVRTERRTYHLHASDAVEVDEWLAAIRDVVLAIAGARTARGANGARPCDSPADESAMAVAAEPVSGGRANEAPELTVLPPLARTASEGAWSDAASAELQPHEQPADDGGDGGGSPERAPAAGDAAARAVAQQRESGVSGAAMLVWFRLASERDAQAVLRAFGTWRHWVEGEMLASVEAMLARYVEIAVGEAGGTPDMLRTSYVPLGDEYGEYGDPSLSYTPFGEALRRAADGGDDDDGAPATDSNVGEDGAVTPPGGSDGVRARAPTTGGERAGCTTGAGTVADALTPPLSRTPSQLARASQLAAIMDELECGMASGAISKEHALALLEQMRARAAGRTAPGLDVLSAAIAAHPLALPSSPGAERARGDGGASFARLVSPGGEAKAQPGPPPAHPRQPRSLSVRIRSAETHSDTRGRYTAYQVALTDGEVAWAIWRRYSQFEVLHQYMLDERGFVPGLPPKARFALRPRVVAERRAQLERYLEELTANLSAFTPEQRKVLGHFLNAPAALMLGA